MKKVLFSISMLMLSCIVAFAQADPKAYAKEVKQAQKAVRDAQREVNMAEGNLNQAQTLIDKAMKYPEITAQPEVWNIAGTIKKKKFEGEVKKLYNGQNYDVNAFYTNLYDAFNLFFKCDEVEKVAVDKKGRPVKIQYHEPNKKFILDNRGYLINGGAAYYNEMKDTTKAIQYFTLYIESASHPMLDIKEDSMKSMVGFYALLASMQTKKYDEALKFANIVKADPKSEHYSKAFEFSAGAYRQMGDTVKWIAELQEGVKLFPDNDYFFVNLLDYYNTSKKYDEALKFADDMVKKDPNDYFMYYVKGFLCQNLEKYEEAIEAYKAAIAIKPDHAEANSNLGLVYCTLARNYQDKMPTNLSNAQYKKEIEVIRNFYREARPYYEKVRELKPTEEQMWLNGLYSIYYMLNMGKELEEIEKLMNN